MKIASIVARKAQQFECVPETTLLADAIALMNRKKIGSVGVVSVAPTRFRGLLSQSDVIAALARRGDLALHETVVGFMQTDVLACHGEDDADRVMLAMTRQRSRHAVVRTFTGTVAALVSLGDLVASMLDEARLEAGVLRDMARSRLMAVPG